MYDEQLTFLESSDFADEQWYLRESAENLLEDWDENSDNDEDAFRFMYLEQTKSIINDMSEHYTELTPLANKVKVNIDHFIDMYLKVVSNE